MADVGKPPQDLGPFFPELLQILDPVGHMNRATEDLAAMPAERRMETCQLFLMMLRRGAKLSFSQRAYLALSLFLPVPRA